MAKALKCDRCGSLYEIYDGIAIDEGGNKYNEMSLQRPWNPISREYDLCPECIKSLFEWLKEVENKRPQGKWIANSQGKHFCSCCGDYALYQKEYTKTYFEKLSNVCPNCSADMSEEETEK